MYTSYGGRQFPMTMDRIIAHELGHYMDRGGDTPEHPGDQMYNVNMWENSIMHRLATREIERNTSDARGGSYLRRSVGQ